MSVTLLHGDCMSYMASLPDNAFELAIVDPPYGIGINMNMGRKKGEPKKHAEKRWDQRPPDTQYFTELERVSQNRIIWGGNYFGLPVTGAWIFWDKSVPVGVTYADGELAWTSFPGTMRKVSLPYCGFVGAEPDRFHPTQKPVALYRWLLHHYAKPGWRILDTHLGSGSSAIAAHEMGFDFVGIEIDADYIAAARKRFDLITRQTKLDL